MNNHICEYGCGQPGKYPPRKGMSKWCCSKTYQQCPGMKEKNIPWNKGKTNVYSKETLDKMKGQTRSHKGKSWIDLQGIEKSKIRKKKLSKHVSYRMKGNIPWNKGLKNCFNDDTIKQMSDSHKKIWTQEKKEEYSKFFTMKLKDYQEKYPFFCSIEELRENKNNEIEVRCKYCNKWFIPTPSQLKERLRAVENQNGSMMSYMYCCKKHQYKCPCSIRIDPKLIPEYEKYVRKIKILTEKNVIKYKDKIKNIDLRGLKFGYQLDHKYSINEGFRNRVDPKIISHYKNFKIIKDDINRSKGASCSISLTKLIKDINNE